MPGTSKTGGDICERLRAESAGQIVSGTVSLHDACVPAAVGVAPGASTASSDAALASAPRRMQVIETRGPQIQIVE